MKDISFMIYYLWLIDAIGRWMATVICQTPLARGA